MSSQLEPEVPDEPLPPTENCAVETAADIIDDVVDNVPQADHHDRRISRGLAAVVSNTTFDSGRSALGMAAAILYTAGAVSCNKSLTQTAIVDNVDISSVTIRNIYRDVPEAALEHDDGSLGRLTEAERDRLEWLSTCDAYSGWVPQEWGL